MVRDWKKYAPRIGEAVQTVIGRGARVYYFGSAAANESVASSDIDILVVVKREISSLKERSALRGLIEDASGLPPLHPFEIHVVDEQEAKSYFRHAGRSILPLEAIKDEPQS